MQSIVDILARVEDLIHFIRPKATVRLNGEVIEVRDWGLEGRINVVKGQFSVSTNQVQYGEDDGARNESVKTVDGLTLHEACREVLGLNADFDPAYGANIARFRLCNAGENPQDYTATAARSGDFYHNSGEVIYSEVNIGVYRGDNRYRLVDVLVGLDGDTKEPCVLVTAGGNGDDSHAFRIYPMRKVESALEIANPGR